MVAERIPPNSGTFFCDGRTSSGYKDMYGLAAQNNLYQWNRYDEKKL